MFPSVYSFSAILFPLATQFLFSSPSFATRKLSHLAQGVSEASTRTLITRDDSTLDACGTLFSYVQQDYVRFDSLFVYNCLVSVPFNQSVATQFITYYKDTLQFQSTLAYLKDPPSSYQQPAVDLLGGLDALQFRVNSNAFDNEYDFEVALQKLIFAAHDSHLYLFGGLTEIFSFGMIYPLISVSIDGIALPKVYLEDDLNSAQEANGQWNASAIATIDGQDVTDFLTQFAASNSLGYSNPDADWNNLMDSPAQDIQYLNNALDGSSPFYPGDVFSIIFENGSTIASTNWIAVLNNDDFDLSINSSQDFYENFVVSDLDDFVGEFSKKRRRDAIIASPRKALTRSSNYKRQTAPDTQNSWNNSAYPSNPVAAEPDLGGEGVLSGYFLNESLTAVLSIPNFNPGNITTFSNTVGQFLRLSKAAGMQKIVVDVQQNYGGDTLLATDTFKQFFPTIDPFAGSRERAQLYADTLGNTYTTAYNSYEEGRNDTLSDFVLGNIWPATQYIDAASGQNFSSWAQYFGPNPDRGDFFTSTQRDNLSSTIFDEEFLGKVVDGFANETNATTALPPYAADDVIILTDSLCASTCTLFVEMMHREAGVKTVVAGGRPRHGPMQTLGGTRGALDYDAGSLDVDIFAAELLNTTLNATLPDRNVEFRIDVANFNLRDQIRNDSYVPLQFIEEVADCRIFYTLLTYNNYTALWQYAADAIWTTPSLCVATSNNISASTKRSEPAMSQELHRRKVAEDSTGPPAGTTCDPGVPNFCGGRICVLSPGCNGNTFIPDRHQCQNPCGLGSQRCATGQHCVSPSTSACSLPNNDGNSCNYCQSTAKPPSRTNCRSSTTRQGRVLTGVQNHPAGNRAQSSRTNEQAAEGEELGSLGDAILYGFRL